MSGPLPRGARGEHPCVEVNSSFSGGRDLLPGVGRLPRESPARGSTGRAVREARGVGGRPGAGGQAGARNQASVGGPQRSSGRGVPHPRLTDAWSAATESTRRCCCSGHSLRRKGRGARGLRPRSPRAPHAPPSGAARRELMGEGMSERARACCAGSGVGGVPEAWLCGQGN